MKEQHDFFFKIDGWTPREMPMGRLVEYMKDLAQLFDSKKHVHIVGIESGSVGLVVDVDESHKEEVKQRVCDAGQGKGRQRSIEAFRRISERLYKDGKEGQLSDRKATILRFSGRQGPTQEKIGPFEQEDSFDGRVIRVGGQENLVPVWLQSGDERIDCLADRDMAKKLAKHLFGEELRVFGTGNRFCDTEGEWRFSRFTITSFEILDDTPLTTLVERLRSIPGNGWEKLEDPWERLKQERED